MSFGNLYSIEVYRLALRDTVNEGGSSDDSNSSNALPISTDATASASVSTRTPMAAADTTKTQSSLCDSEQQELTDVVRLEPIAPFKQPALEPSTPSSSSQRVLLVTRPSQRDMAIWTQRATSKMVRSAGGTMRPQAASSAQSRRWVLEYKPVVYHSGWLIKRGAGRLRGFKRRLFCIIDNELVYHDSHSASEVRGRVDLSKPSTVQSLPHSGLTLAQGSKAMTLYAVDAADRDTWIRKLQDRHVHVLAPSVQQPLAQSQQRTAAAAMGTDTDRILFAGWLRKRGQVVKSTKRRWFELSSNATLTYYTHPQGGTKKGALDVTNATIAHMDTLKSGERHSFQVRTASRRLVLHADSQEERSLWVASLAAAAEGGGSSSSVSDAFATMSIVSETERVCTCGGIDTSRPASQCPRCCASFIAPSEDALVDVTREVQLILASPYSPEGSTSGAFIRDHSNSNRPVSNTVIRQFMAGLADYMIDTRMHELRLLGGHLDAAATSDDEADGYADNVADDASSDFADRILAIIYDQVEERVVFPLYKTIHDNIVTQTRADAKVINSKIEVLRTKPQSFFGIGPESLSPSDWATAAAKLKDIDKVSLPYMKRAQLLVASKEIYSVYHAEHPLNAPMSADEFIPAFIFVLIQSRLDDPTALRELLTSFDNGSTHGEVAYFVTCFEIALEYIRSLLTACTVVLDATRSLGIEFARDSVRGVAVVHSLVVGGQAAQSRAVTVGDVVVAVNGLPVYEMALDEIVKLIRSIDGDAELCFLPMDEYEARFGMMSRNDSDDGDVVRSGASRSDSFA